MSAAEPASNPPYNGAGATDAAFALLVLLSILPVFFVRYPECADCLNHMARLFVLTAPANHPVHLFYHVHWHLLPNLGFELVALPLTGLFSLETVMKCLWVLCVLSLAAAAWFVHRALFARTRPTFLLSALLLLNLPLAGGFMSYLLGVSAALATVGWWLRLADHVTVKKLVLLNLLTGLILIVHFAAAAALMLTIALLQMGSEPRTLRVMAGRTVAILPGFILPVLLLVLIALSTPAHSGPMWGASSWAAISYGLEDKLSLITATFFTGHSLPNLAGSIFWIAAILMLWLGGRPHPRLRLTLALWLLVLLVMPYGIGRATIIDLRLAIFPAVLFAAAFDFVPVQRFGQAALAAVALAGVCARTALLIPAWQRHDADVRSFRAIDDAVAPGSTVLVASAPRSAGKSCAEPARWPPFDEHVPTLLTIDRAAFVSTLFASPTMQPIEPAASVRGDVVENAGIVPWRVLRLNATAAGRRWLRTAPASSIPRLYAEDWQEKYDYLAVRRVNCARQIAPRHGLVPIAQSATYQLYRIVHPRTPSGRPAGAGTHNS